MDSIEKQFDRCTNKILQDEYYFIIPQLVLFGEYMVKDVLPEVKEYNDLTGNTITSYAYGVYHRGKLEAWGFSDYPDPIRNKLVKNETVADFIDYNGRKRTYFTGNIDTDAGFGERTSKEFLKNYQCKEQYGIVFCTGTEYSEYLQNVLKLDVLSGGYQMAKGIFIKSFKPIK